MRNKKIWGGALGLIAFIVFYMIPAAEPFTPRAFVGIGCLVTAVIWILFEVVPDYVAAMAMSVAFVLTGSATVEVAFAQFSSTTIWIVVGALILGTAASESGLLKRVALYLMKILPATYGGQCMALLISGILISPLIPSTSAKATVMAPITKTTGEALGLKAHSKGALGLFMAFFTGYISSANGYLSGSFISYALAGLMPDGYEISWGNWFFYGLPFLIISTMLMTVVILKFWKPKEKSCIPKDVIDTQFANMGPLSWKEKLTAAVMAGCLFLWMMERTWNIPASMVACAGALIVMTAGICDKKSFRSKIPWEGIIFIGCFVGVTNVFDSLKINAAISELIGDQLNGVVGNPYILVIFLCLVTFALRMLIVSMAACTTLTTVLLMPLCIIGGIHPFILIFVGYAAGNIWIFSYQNSSMILSLTATDHQMVTHKDLISASVFNMFFCVAACMACVPVWQMLGLC